MVMHVNALGGSQAPEKRADARALLSSRRILEKYKFEDEIIKRLGLKGLLESARQRGVREPSQLSAYIHGHRGSSK